MEKISPKAIKVWRISESITAAVMLLAAVAAFILSQWVWDFLPWWISLILFVIFVIQMVIFVWLMPKLKYKYFRYEVLADEIKIHQGILIKDQNQVPLYRVQNIDTNVGPLMRKYGLKSVSLRTSAERIQIPELEKDEADRIRNDIRTLINEHSRREL